MGREITVFLVFNTWPFSPLPLLWITVGPPPLTKGPAGFPLTRVNVVGDAGDGGLGVATTIGGGGAAAAGAAAGGGASGGLFPVPGTGVITTLPFTDLMSTWPPPPPPPPLTVGTKPPYWAGVHSLAGAAAADKPLTGVGADGDSAFFLFLFLPFFLPSFSSRRARSSSSLEHEGEFFFLL